jgi:preprotein translocase subunit SecD
VVAAVLIAFSAAGCKKHINNAKPVAFAVHEVVDCSRVQAVPVPNPRSNEKTCVDSQAIVTEKNVRYAQLSHDGYQQPQVVLYLDHTGGTLMYEATQRISARHDNGQVAILIDGRIYNTPVVRGTIQDSLVIQGEFTETAAQDLADGLTAGK